MKQSQAGRDFSPAPQEGCTLVYGIYSPMLHRLVAQEPQARPHSSACSGLYHVAVYKCRP